MTGIAPIQEHAPAKINLYLHLTGRRADGYHILESLVVFTELGDRLTLASAPAYSLTLSGPFARALQSENPAQNLITRALQGLAQRLQRPADFAVSLEKNLPIASGIGGGSADAAAALRAAARLWDISPDHPAILETARHLGTDIVPCLAARSLYMTGVGDEIAPAPPLPGLTMLLVNPGVAVPTPEVYAAKARNAPGHFTPAARLADAPMDAQALIEELALRRNDLYPHAARLFPQIDEVLKTLWLQAGCRLARMCGSGATCYALFDSPAECAAAAENLRIHRPEWWGMETKIL